MKAILNLLKVGNEISKKCIQTYGASEFYTKKSQNLVISVHFEHTFYDIEIIIESRNI